MYGYEHNDGRTAEHSSGTWYAIKTALGTQEAVSIVEKSDSPIWQPSDTPGRYREADLCVEGEKLGVMYES